MLVPSKNKQKYKLTSTERDILLFFVEKGIKQIPYSQLWKEMVIDKKKMKDVEFHIALTSLIKKDLVTEIPNTNYIPLIWASDTPAVVKIMLDLERYTSAVLLCALVRFYCYFIKNKRPCIFNIHDFLLAEQEYNIKLFYLSGIRYKRNLRDALHELTKRGYIISKNKYVYTFKYEQIPQEIINYI